MPARVVYFCATPACVPRGSATHTHSVPPHTHTHIAYNIHICVYYACACLCVRVVRCCVRVASNLFDITPLAHHTIAVRTSRGRALPERCVGLSVRAEHVLCVLPFFFTCCSGNSVGMESALDCCCTSRNFSQTRGQQPSHVLCVLSPVRWGVHTHACVCFCYQKSQLVCVRGGLHRLSLSTSSQEKTTTKIQHKDHQCAMRCARACLSLSLSPFLHRGVWWVGGARVRGKSTHN